MNKIAVNEFSCKYFNEDVYSTMEIRELHFCAVLERC